VRGSGCAHGALTGSNPMLIAHVQRGYGLRRAARRGDKVGSGTCDVTNFTCAFHTCTNQHRSAIPSNVIRPSVEMPGCPSKRLRSALSTRRDELGPWQTPLEWGDAVAAPRHAAAWKTQHGSLARGLGCHIEPRNHLYRPAFPCYQIPWFPRCDRGKKPTPTALEGGVLTRRRQTRLFSFSRMRHPSTRTSLRRSCLSPLRPPRSPLLA
jgi:hypothetical protein